MLDCNIDIFNINEPFKDIQATQKYAIATLVMDSHDYAQSAAVLIETLIQNNMNLHCDFIVFAANIPQESIDLLELYAKVVKVPKIEFPTNLKIDRFVKNYESWLNACFTKLYVYLLIQYEKVLFLDADMMCQNDFTHVFNLPTPFGTIVGKDKIGMESGIKIRVEDLQYALMSGYGISGAFFCIQPDISKFQSLLQVVKDNSQLGYYQQFVKGQVPNAGPDEVLISLNNEGWTNVSRQFCCLPWLAQKFEKGAFALSDSTNSYDFDLTYRKVFLVHFVAEKPWQSAANSIKKGDKIWEDVKNFYDVLLQVKAKIGDKKISFFDIPGQNMWMTRQECDRIYENDYRRKFDNKKKFR